MKTTVRISGVIVDSSYDCDWLDRDIANGTLTPSSRAIYAIASAAGDLEVRVNSYGGDVFAAKSIITALKQWAETHPKADLAVTVEALAASAAANLLVCAPKRAKIRAYSDSLIMFHSCSTLTFGGPGAHKDAAALMDRINQDVQSQLLARTTLAEETVAEWFAEGRQGWLTADEARAVRLIGAVVTDAAPDAPPRPADNFQGAAQVAALFATKTQKEQKMPLDNTPKAEDKEEEKDKGKDIEQTAPAAEEDDKEEKKEDEKEDEKEEKKETDQQADSGVQARIATLEQTVAELTAALKAANAKAEALTAGFRSKSAPASAHKAFADLLAEIPADLPQAEWDDRFLALRQEHPQAFQDWMKRK